MDQFLIQCPKCGTRLTVPSSASGKTGRCPHCKNMFRVPKKNVIFEETVTAWLAPEEEEDDDDIPPLPAGAIDKLAREHGEKQRGPRPETPVEANEHVDSSGDEPTSIDEPSSDASSKPALPRRPAVPGGEKPAPRRPAPPPEKKPEEPKDTGIKQTSSGKLVYEVRSAVRSGRRVEEDKPPPPKVEAPRQPPRPKPMADSPERPLSPPEGQVAPRRQEERANGAFLAVVDVSAAGVRLSFNAQLLKNTRFRASMPFKCMSCGVSEASQLVARPLAWINKATGHFAKPGELEALYEVHVHANQNVRDVLGTMRVIDELPTPLNNPVPYFVCTKCSSRVTVHCETYSTTEGVFCEVTIPGASYALEWLGRVNGVCGEDYERLESQVTKFEEAGWRQIPDQVRQRLSAWFDFEPGEQFVAYFNDGDFTRKDAGLAGVVVTDRRMVYCKYHHHGSVRLEEEGQLNGIKDGVFYNFEFQQDGSTRRLIRMRREDAYELASVLEQIESPLVVHWQQTQ